MCWLIRCEGSCSFLKKRTKKLLPIAHASGSIRDSAPKSFASFFVTAQVHPLDARVRKRSKMKPQSDMAKDASLLSPAVLIWRAC
jgi:hypothetical protein